MESKAQISHSINPQMFAKLLRMLIYSKFSQGNEFQMVDWNALETNQVKTTCKLLPKKIAHMHINIDTF